MLSTYIYDEFTSFNFELHPADQTELILKILLYAGVVVKDPQIVQVAAQQVATRKYESTKIIRYGYT